MGQVKQTELAERWGVAKQSVGELVKKGMPLTSIADAEAWRARRRGGKWTPASVRPGETPKESHDDAEGESVEVGEVAPVAANTARAMLAELEKQHTAQKKIVNQARERFGGLLGEGGKDGGDVVAANQAGNTYNASVKLKVMIEKELVQRKIDAGDLIPKAVAVDRSVRVLASIRAAIESSKTDLVNDANPDDAPRAMRAFDKFQDKIFKLISEGMPR